MEEFFLSQGFSHLWSKAIPYLATICFGLLLARLVYTRFRSNKKMAVVLGIFFAIVPFIAYFAVQPIYEGDFSRNGKTISIKNETTKKVQDGLLVLAIPGCPFCLESISHLKQMKKRRPHLKIEFGIIATLDSAAIEPYKKAIDDKFSASFVANETLFTNVTGSSFPTFVLIENGVAIQSWTNNEFGVRAKDWVENAH